MLRPDQYVTKETMNHDNPIGDDDARPYVLAAQSLRLKWPNDVDTVVALMQAHAQMRLAAAVRELVDLGNWVKQKAEDDDDERGS